MHLKLVLTLSLSMVAISAHAKLQLLPSGVNSNKNDYRLGDEWGKKKVTSETLKTEGEPFVRTALATAYLPVGGTAFYLGKFNQTHVIATNHHVCPKANECVGDKANFRLLGKSFKMTKFFVTIPEVDITLLAIDVPVKDENQMANVAKNFSFNQDVYKSQELITIGFGIGGNPNNNLMANQDSDCKVFSHDGEYRHMADPDDINPGTYKAWSFANGCDVSHGDSGSAMVDRKTGDIVGIIWTGKIPKSKIAQNSANLNKMFENSDAAIWKELSYAVPAVKIKVYLQQLSESDKIEVSTRSMLKTLIRD